MPYPQPKTPELAPLLDMMVLRDGEVTWDSVLQAYVVKTAKPMSMTSTLELHLTVVDPKTLPPPALVRYCAYIQDNNCGVIDLRGLMGIECK